MAANHLIKQGQKHISYVGHNLTDSSSVDWSRLRGFKKALYEKGLSFDEELLFNGYGSSFEVGFNIGKLLLKLENKMTGIFASSDVLTVGIINAFREHGKDIPKDYSIICFDDLEISRYFYPRLSMIKQNVFNKGVVSIQTLIDAIESKINNPVSKSARKEQRFVA